MSFKKLSIYILLQFFFLFIGVPPIFADTANLTVNNCYYNDTASPSCLSALESNDGMSYAFGKSKHLDAPFDTLSASAVSSAILYYDSWAVLSGTWAIYVKDARDGTTICSVDPAPENLGDTTDSTSCSVTPTQLSNGIWLQADNNDSGKSEDVNLDYVRLYVNYTPPVAVSISMSTDGSVGFGTLALNSTQDTTASGIDDTEVISVDSGPADLDAKSNTFSDGGNTWSLSTSSGSDQVHWEFSPDGSAWTSFAAADTLYSLATNVSQSSTQDIDLKLTLPTSTSSYSQHSTTVTIQASVP